MDAPDQTTGQPQVGTTAVLGHDYLAGLISSSRGWVRRALRGDASAKSIRYRVAETLSLEDATQLGLAFEWEVENKKRTIRKGIEATVSAGQPTSKRYTTKGIGMWVQPLA